MATREPSFKEYKFQREGLTALILRQLQVQDDIEIGMRVDTAAKNDPRGGSMSLAAYLALQKREAVRLSIVAVCRDGGAWERVNETEPFAEMTTWLESSYARLLDMHQDLNSVTEEEDFRKGAVSRSSAEVVAMIGRAQNGPTAPAAPGSAEPAGT